MRPKPRSSTARLFLSSRLSLRREPSSSRPTASISISPRRPFIPFPSAAPEIVAYPDDEFSVNVNVDFNSKIIGNQYARLDRMEDFAEQIAPCRTFVFLHELEPLINNNLIKGGDLDNAIVIVENRISDEELDRLSKIFDKRDGRSTRVI